MAIRVERNEQGNCVNFHGSSNPTYWNACLTAYVDDNVADTINIVNDIITAQTGITEYEFYQIPYTEFTRADNSDFATAQEAAAYITQAARVIGVSPESSGNDLTGVTVCFSLDDTHTSVILDNGYSFGVNTIKAIAEGGVIEIHSISGDRTLFSNLDASNVCINGLAVSGGLNDVVNTLNELFTVGAFTSVVISDPYSTMVADVSGAVTSTTLINNGFDPIGDDVYATSENNANTNGFKTAESIDQAGEYFTFDIRNEAIYGFGLVHTQASYDNGLYSGNSTYADPSIFGITNNSHAGFQFSHWFHPTPNGSWTNYGANTSYVTGPGWSNWESQDEWLAGNPVKIKVGIDENGFIAISSLQDDGVTWVMHARSSYSVPQGASFHLGIKAGNQTARVYSQPKVHLLEPSAPTMYFRYIESPDNTFVWPLFATSEEAEYYDEIVNSASTPASHTHTYADDPTNTTWYMPKGTHDAASYEHSAAPSGETFNGQTVTYTEITSLTNADLVPPAFSNANLTEEEGTAINIPLMPADATYSQSASISPSGSGLVYNTQTGYLQGTLADVGADTTYTITVTRANSYGSSVGSFTITATDVAPAQTHTTSWTKALDFSGSSERAAQVSGGGVYSHPLMLSGSTSVHSTWVSNGNTHSASNSRPWAVAIVFKADGNASNQHIWNQGEGAGSTDDNIYLRIDANRRLYFGWGRSGSLNEFLIHPANTGTGWQLTTSNWYGIYIAHNGVRLSGSNATPSNLADMFDIRLMGSSDSWTSGSDVNLMNTTDWQSSGARMDRTYLGDFTIGGRGSNRNFHGKVASCLVRTLKNNVAMPNATEIEEMITDPLQWQTDYMVGNTYRPANSGTNLTNYQIGQGQAIYAVQMWLMGDGTNDSYSNMIRNQADPNDQNYTKLNMVSMVSNDIETVNISGLT
jgi:hypothetical protein